MKTTLYIIYHGPWQETAGKWTHHYAILTDRSKVETAGPNYVFDKPVKGITSVGVFEMEGEETENGIRYTLSTVKWHSRFEENAGAMTRALVDVRVSLHRSFRTAKTETWLDSLSMAREVYKKSRGAQRNHVLALIVREITK